MGAAMYTGSARTSALGRAELSRRQRALKGLHYGAAIAA